VNLIQNANRSLFADRVTCRTYLHNLGYLSIDARIFLTQLVSGEGMVVRVIQALSRGDSH